MTKFNITSSKLVASWTFDLDTNKDCTICRFPLNQPSNYAIDNDLNSQLSIGVCGHGFHDECLRPWLKNNPRCPICVENWQHKENKQLI